MVDQKQYLRLTIFIKDACQLRQHLKSHFSTQMRKLKMKNLIQTMKTPSKKERGATMVEYAIMVALIAVVSIVTIQGLGTKVNATFKNVSDHLPAS
jgi:pilus assembly protein Flp/PilA